MKKLSFLLSFVAVCVPSLAVVQERAAGGPVETQMTWSALSEMVKSANLKTDGVNARVDQIVVCNRKAMAYAPGFAGADSEGCIENSKLLALQTRTTTLETRMTAVGQCGAAGSLYNGSGCSPINAAQKRNCAWVPFTHGDYALTCPANKFQAGIHFEGATYSGARDNHAGPEIDNILCCDL